MAFLDRGRDVLKKVVAAVDEFGKVEMEPRMEGAYMRIMIAPNSETPVKKQPVQKEAAPEKQDAERAPIKAKAKSSFELDADKI